MSEFARQALVFADEKKHSVRYNAEEGVVDPAVIAIYIMKSALPTPFPEVVEVTFSD